MPENATPATDEPAESVGGPDEDDGTALGEILRRERLRRNLSLEELARSARVPVHYLEALEEEDFSGLPPRIYVRGYLDALAGKLSLSAADVHRRFDECLAGRNRQRREETIFGLFRPEGEKFQWRDWLVPLLLLLGAMAFLAGRGAFEGTKDMPEPPLSPPPVPLDPGEGSAPEGTFEPREFPPPGPARPSSGGVSVLIRGVATTWLSAERDGGAKEEYAVRAGESMELKARERVVLSLGNAGAVRLVYNGREIGFIGRKGEVKRNLVFVPEKK